MAITEVIFDKRKHHRFAASGSAFVHFDDDLSQLGEIIDIGMGGLSFRYFGEGKQRRAFSHFNVLLSDGCTKIARIPFHTVSDMEMYDDLPVGSLTRRCSVQFGAVTKVQRSAIVRLIENHTSLAKDLSVEILDQEKCIIPGPCEGTNCIL